MRRYLFSVTLVPIALGAQTPREIQLQPPTARLDAELSDITSVRELSDGRVLLFDRKEERFTVADLGTGAMRDVSRRGGGPGEFQVFIARLLPLRGDSTLAADITRWLILDGDSVVATLPPNTPAMQAVNPWPISADQFGHVLTERSAPRGESAYVAIVDRATGRSDSIARLRAGVRRAPVRAVTLPDGQKGMAISRIPLDVREASVLFSDGWMAIARLEPYRVDWRSPAGQWTRGAPLPFRAIRVNDREKEAFAARNTWARNATDWPELLPPFDTSPTTPLFAASDGTLLVRRLPTADQPESRYDLVDRRGMLKGQLVLSTTQHILGFGAESVYVITTDDDGLQTLTRHPWPPVAR